MTTSRVITSFSTFESVPRPLAYHVRAVLFEETGERFPFSDNLLFDFRGIAGTGMVFAMFANTRAKDLEQFE